MDASIKSETLAFLFDPAARHNPYPFFDRLRSQAPVHRTGFRSILLTKWSDVETALSDARLGFDPDSAIWQPYARSPAVDAYFKDMMSMRDGTDHSRLRGLVTDFFGAATAGKLRGQVNGLVRDAVANAAESGHLDAVADLAVDLPLNLACILLDIPVDDRAAVRKWGHCLTQQLLVYHGNEEDLAAAEQEVESMAAYLLALAGDRDTGILGRLASARDMQEITDGELIAFAMMLIISGTETATHAISSTLSEIIQHDQADLLHDQPDLIPAAVQECLRLESPVRLVARTALTDLEIGGRRVYQREVVIPVLAAANRDPRRFEDPASFRYGRRNGHISFGRGPHFCLGRALGLMLTQIVVSEIVAGYRISAAFDQPTWSRSLAFRSLDELPIVLTRR